jgi:hypothetical protein
MADSSDYSSPCYSGSSPSPQPAQRKSQVLEDILEKLGPVNKVSYTPFKIEPPQDPKPLLPGSFSSNPHPFDYFSLFFTPDLFKTITKNTNRCASIYRFQVQQERAREWSDVLVEEFYVFVGVILYMGVHYKPQIELYWNPDFAKVPCTPFQPIYPSVVLNKSSVTVTFRALIVTSKRDITYLLIRSGGISLSRLLQPFRPPVENITPLRRK